MLIAVGVFIVAAALLTFIAQRVAHRATQQFDDTIRHMMQSHRTKAMEVVTKPITMLSIPLVVVSATAVLVWWLHHRGHNNAALAIGVTPAVAATVGQAFTSYFPQRSPPDEQGRQVGKKPSATFPSGHTTGVTAEGLAIAYVLASEGLASPAVVALLLAWPVIVGLTRLYRDRHWCSDIVAGWVTGAGVASLSIMLYSAHLL
jgi:membrane-associated phospholipid phosphatase